MNISINCHASVRLETEDGIMYFDPFKIKTPANDGDYIFVTHSHFDHFSPDDIEKTAHADTKIIVPESMFSDAVKAGFSEDCIIPLAPNSTVQLGALTVEAVPAYNTSKPMHKKEYGWLGYIVSTEGKRVYVSGDIDAIDEGKNVSCDIAFVPVGGTYTMNVKEAAAFINEMKPKTAIPYHYGSIVGFKSCGQKFKALVDDSINVCLYI